MKKIILSGGYQCTVDDDDYERYGHLKWYRQSAGYAVRRQFFDGVKKSQYLHRLIADAPEGVEVDHIDRDTLNNCKSNLRLCSHFLNHGNRWKLKTCNPTSRFRGVHWAKEKHKWMVTTRGANGKTKYLGRFNDEIEAAKAFNRYAVEKYGQYARLNEIAV